MAILAAPQPLMLLSLLLVASSIHFLRVRGDDVATPSVNLGLLLPFPQGDSAIPERLAQEWISAAKVAVEVLTQKYSGFTVNILKENSNCDYQTAKDAAQNLLDQGVVGVVGPACSSSALGAMDVLGPAGIPVVSFAATSPELGSHQYPTFFRTAFSDEHQASAVVAVVEYFSMTKIYLFNTQDAYGTSIADLISAKAKDANISVTQIPVDVGSGAEYSSYFSMNGEPLSTDKETLVVFATTPQAAEGLWRAALTLDKLSYPWWYLGTDGATAFDLVGQGDNLTDLIDKLQGEIGIAPYKGDFNMPRSPLTPFFDFWSIQSYDDYPGLLTLPFDGRFEHPRAYSTYLIDAVWTFYESFAQILFVQKKSTVEASDILQCLCNENCMNLKMTTGQVRFICETGERSADAQAPQYSFVNLVGLTWEEKGRFSVDDRGLSIGSAYTNRPGPIPEGNPKFVVAGEAPPAPTGSEAAPSVNWGSFDVFGIFSAPKDGSSSWSYHGLSTVAIVFLVLGIVAGITGIVIGGIWAYRKRQERKQQEYQQFVHVLPEPTSFPLFNK